MAQQIAHKCIICGRSEILSATFAMRVRVSCRICGAEFQIEWEPPDAPELRGRITLLREPVRPVRAVTRQEHSTDDRKRDD
jgi:hypothetical protein